MVTLMGPLVSRMYRVLKQLVAPPFCAYCKRFLESETVLCSWCMQAIVPVVSHELVLSDTKRMRVLAVGRYQEPLISLILAKSSARQVVSVQLGTLVWRMSAISHIPFDCVVPIPLHWTRYARRGYNQAQEMARVIVRESKKPMLTLLKRSRKTPYLAPYAAVARQRIMRESFVLQRPEGSWCGKHILLVDDVMTTGVTLRAAAKELLKLNPAAITAVVAARVVR